MKENVFGYTSNKLNSAHTIPTDGEFSYHENNLYWTNDGMDTWIHTKASFVSFGFERYTRIVLVCQIRPFSDTFFIIFNTYISKLTRFIILLTSIKEILIRIAMNMFVYFGLIKEEEEP